MNTISVKTSQIIIEKDMDINAHLSSYKKIFVISDENVAKIYLDKINHTDSYIIKPGEESKNIDTVQKIIEKLLDNNYTRHDLIVSLGGGVVSDISGFVASTYKRGMEYISIPTSLLCMVDASIGGKTGVNFNSLKNEIGSFYFPKKVLIDINFLSTLPVREYRNGLSEIVKVASTCDIDLFNRIGETVDEEIISRAIEIKKVFVESDTNDLDERRVLNFGHTLAHAIESDSMYKVSHGEAVAIGMHLITRFSEKMNLTIANTAFALERKLNSLKLPTSYDKGVIELKKYIINDKKVDGKSIEIVVIPEIGRFKIVNIDLDLLK